MTLTYIFHSGFEMEETFNPIAHEKQFLGELKDIRKVADSFDVSKSDCSSLCTSLQALNPLGA